MRKFAVSAVVLASLGAVACGGPTKVSVRAASIGAGGQGSVTTCGISSQAAPEEGARDGILRIAVGDGLNGEKSEKRFYFEEQQDGARRTRPLDAPLEELRGLSSGTRLRIQVTPSNVSAAAAADDGRTVKAIHVRAIAAPQGVAEGGVSGVVATGDFKTAIIPVNFSDDSVGCTADQLQSMILGSGPTSAGTVAQSFYENSYGAIRMTGTVLPAVTLATTTDDAYHNWMQWGDMADAAERSNGVSLAGYTNFVYVYPWATYQGGIAGWAALGDNRAFNMGACTYKWVYEHEIGHNFGFDHAGTTDASGAPSCDTCDSQDVMGYGNPRLMHAGAVYKEDAHWLPVSAYRPITSGGTFQLSPLESSTADTQVIKFRKTGSKRTIYVAYRKALGIDAFLSGMGASDSVHVTIRDAGYLPGSGFSSARLKPGESFTEPNTGARIAFRVAGSTQATVDVDLSGSGSMDTLPIPSGPPAPSGGGPSGGPSGGPGGGGASPTPTPRPTPSGSGGC